ncbi:MAG: hypothetical protein FJ088_10865, partial [Deltaproteobacteria bacterium]|nr:hypothetical protein [Deltaproteobacteria bacterium]
MRKSFVFIAAVLLILSSCSGGADGGMDVLDTTPEHSEEVFQDAEILEYYENAEPEEALYDSKDVNDEVKLYVEELISAGKAHLANAEPYLALQEFEKALEIDPENVDAIFGAALAELIDATELMMMVFLMTSQFSDPPPVGGESFADESFRRYHRGKDSAPTLHITSIFSPSQNDYFAEEIHNIFMRLRSHFEDALKRLEKIEGKPLNFDVEKAPVYFYTKPVLIYRGAFTGGDVYLMESIVECVLGIFEFLAGQDLRTDVLTMVHFVKSNVGDFNLKELIKLLAYLINEGDTFLSLHPADGENLFYAAKEHFADVSIKLHKALDEIAAEEGSGDRVSSVTEGKNGEKILKIRNGVAEILGDAVIEKELE